jgi:long-chain acyl-CoA synthetase
LIKRRENTYRESSKLSSKRQLGVKLRPIIAPTSASSRVTGLALNQADKANPMQTTFPRLLLNHATQRPTDTAMREKEFGIWQATSWAAMAALVEHLACGLHQAGLRQHDHMVVIGANRPRLYATMLAVQSLGAVPIALYQDAAAPECVFPLNNAEVRFAFAEDQEQVDKML